MVGKGNTKKNVYSNNKLEQSNNYEAVIKHPILPYFRLWVVRKKNENQKQHLNQSQETINNSEEMVIHSRGLQNPLFPSPAA